MDKPTRYSGRLRLSLSLLGCSRHPKFAMPSTEAIMRTDAVGDSAQQTRVGLLTARCPPLHLSLIFACVLFLAQPSSLGSFLSLHSTTRRLMEPRTPAIQPATAAASAGIATASVVLHVDPSLHQRHESQQHVREVQATFDDVGLESLCIDEDTTNASIAKLPLALSPETNIDDLAGASSAFILFRTRMRRNIIRVTFAGALSTLGAIIAGFFPSLTGILVGGFIAGVGNGVSTWLDWEKSRGHVIRARLVHDFDRAVEAVAALSMQIIIVATALASQQASAQPAGAPSSYQSAECSSVVDGDSEPIVPAFVDTPIDPRVHCGVSRRYRVNFVHCFIAGILSAAGGWLAGFEAVAWGIVVGAVLSGVGNSVSTALFLEEPNDQRVQLRALQDVPDLIHKINAAGDKWGQMQAKLPAHAAAALVVAQSGNALTQSQAVSAAIAA